LILTGDVVADEDEEVGVEVTVAVKLELEADVEDSSVLVVALLLDEDVIDVEWVSNDALVTLVGVCEGILVEFASRS
jgi:hypothetical protein